MRQGALTAITVRWSMNFLFIYIFMIGVGVNVRVSWGSETKGACLPVHIHTHRLDPFIQPSPPTKQALCETLGGQGAGCEWWEPYALSLLRRVLSSYKGAKAIVAAADKVRGLCVYINIVYIS